MKRIFLIWLLATVYSSDFHRLSSNVIPTDYAITLTLPALAKCSKKCMFQGSVDIRIISKAALVNEVTFHIKDITITSVILKKDTILSRTLKIVSQQYYKDVDKYTLILAKPLEERAKYIVKITYEGEISNDNSGFYLASYKTSRHEAK